MKHLLPLVIASLLCYTPMHAQNHVPNPSFEDKISCPTGLLQFTGKCALWTTFGGSPDYYNRCAVGTDVAVPVNAPGCQQPVAGNAYTGIVTYDASGNFEYIGVPITHLQRGGGYIVSMSVSRADSCTRASDNLGVFFYKAGYTTTPINPYNSFLSMIPQVHYSNLGTIKDTSWVRLSKYFVADSAYDHIIIGGFNNLSGTYDTSVVKGGITGEYAYYYIDSVVITPVDPSSVGNMAVDGLTSFPNPTNGRFVVKGNALSDKVLHIAIVNTLGQLVYNQEVQPSQGALNKEINLDVMPKGIYLLRISDDAGNVSTQKLRIE